MGPGCNMRHANIALILVGSWFDAQKIRTGQAPLEWLEGGVSGWRRQWVAVVSTVGAIVRFADPVVLRGLCVLGAELGRYTA